MKETVLDCEFVILNRLPELYSAQRFQAEIDRHKLNAKLISPEVLIDQSAQIEARGLRPAILYRQGEFNFWATQQALSKLPFKIINSPTAFLAARDKWATAQLWQKENIPIPKTILSSALLEELPTAVNRATITQLTSALYNQMTSHLGSPFILKKRFSSQGRGVFLIESSNTLLDVIQKDETSFQNSSSIETEYFNQSITPKNLPASSLGLQLSRWMAQESITESFGQDVRVFITSSSRHSVERKNRNSFRSNIHQGGIATPTELSTEEDKLSMRAHQMSGLTYSGIDFLRTKNGPLFLEANPSPGFEGIEKAYPNLNIAYDLLSMLKTT